MDKHEAKDFLNRVALSGTWTDADLERLVSATPMFRVSHKQTELFYKLTDTLQQPRTVKFTPGRLAKLIRRLKTFSEEELLSAGQELANNDFMMGDNDSKTKYATIDYLLRNDEIVDKLVVESGGTSRTINLKEAKF